MERNFDQEIEEAGQKLRPKQKKFADHYLLNNNIRAAYYYAGYTAKTHESAQAVASDMLRNANVQQYIELNRARINHVNQVTMDKVIAETAKIAFGAGLESLVQKVGSEVALTDDPDFSILDSVSSSVSESNGDAVSSRSNSFSFKRKDRLKALDMLAKMLGGYNAKLGASGSDEGATARRVLEALGRVRKKE